MNTKVVMHKDPPATIGRKFFCAIGATQNGHQTVIGGYICTCMLARVRACLHACVCMWLCACLHACVYEGNHDQNVNQIAPNEWTYQQSLCINLLSIHTFHSTYSNKPYESLAKNLTVPNNIRYGSCLAVRVRVRV